MDRPSVHHGRSPKQAKSKKKPIKVVYISNPMKVRSTVSNFRALVHSLTGRGSDIEKALAMNGADELYRVPDLGADQATDDKPSPVMLVPTVDHERESSASTGSSSSSSFEPVDDVFTQEMLEDFAGSLPLRPSSGFSFDHFFLRNLDV